MGYSRYPVYAICLLALAYQSLGQATDIRDITYADKNITVAGVPIKFRSEPRGRGTTGIILSCVATFLFCIWGTVHPNIIVGAKSYYRLFYKAVLMLVAIVVPEGLILSAFAQYRQAKDLHNLWLKQRRDEHEEEDEPWYTFLKFWQDSKSTFGMEGAFFVVMGGFVVKRPSTGTVRIQGQGEEPPVTIDQNASGEQDTFFRKREQDEGHVILTYEGFKHYIDLIDKDDMGRHRQAILDKGKASNMAKCLAGLQALWLIVQCFARWQAGLPVTLLEVHVAIQVVCTMIIFFCWWGKPLDVNQHIEITLRRRVRGTFPAALHQTDLEGGLNEAEQELVYLTSEEKKLRDNRKTNFAVNPKGQRFIFKKTPPDLTGITAKAFYDMSSCLDNSNNRHNSEKDDNLEKGGRSEVRGDAGKKSHWKAMGAEASLVFLTGALHAAAWNFPFENQCGRVLWRASSIGMCVCPTLAVFIASITAYQVDLVTAVWEIHLGHPEDYKKKRHLWGVTKAISDQLLRMAERHGYRINQEKSPRSKRGGCFMTSLHFLLMWVVLLLLIAYAVSIITITIISFVSMRSLPVGSFNTPRWNDYWPHF
ncbi:uncharacterized protein LAJ45_03728 [Morchella importuna]|uniref:uncharacterized protein n=1 Tax=Morchella importuna TaxID=1174673 RepID=UPI001E8EAC17|nr:uncharacterized protein LAJ45_03728 [Morchella importuna]KAH8152301.1 hypothetical protein LAJ45_03728 [Morchella importuna]